MGYKECNKCKQVKEVGEFSRDRKRKDGRKSICRECISEERSGGKKAYQRSEDELKYDMSTSTKICSVCKVRKSFDDFTRNKVSPDKKGSWCKECASIKRRDAWLKDTYGISMEEYNTLLSKQGGGCAICKVEVDKTGIKSLSVDHDHETGAVRGILCRDCNTAIGKLGDSVEGLMKAVDYLRRNDGKR